MTCKKENKEMERAGMTGLWETHTFRKGKEKEDQKIVLLRRTISRIHRVKKRELQEGQFDKGCREAKMVKD